MAVRTRPPGPSPTSRYVHIHGATDLAQSRTNLIEDVSTSLPTETGTLSYVPSPVLGLHNLEACEKLTTSYASRPRLWTPDNTNGTIVLLHQGHGSDYTELRYDEVLQQLLSAGYTVCGFVMPGGADEVTSGGPSSHGDNEYSLEEHVGPIVVAINTLTGFDHVHMIGLSGGGWATTVAAAMDTRIENTYPIAGSLPEHFPAIKDRFSRDYEQRLSERNVRASYLDLYLLGSCPTGRRQKQILHETDDCCFDEIAYAAASPYGSVIATIADDLGGEFDLVWRDKTIHEFDTTIIAEEVLTEI